MDWSIDRHADEPIQDQVENLLRALITQDEYQQGKVLPGDTEIAEQLDISRNTVRSAMQRLVDDGLIIREKGYGSIVKRTKIDVNIRAWTHTSEEIEAKADSIQEYETNFEWVLPPKISVNVFDADPHIQIPKLKRVLGDDAGPMAIFVSYFHPRIDIDQDETFDETLYEDILEPKYGISPATANETIKTKMPDNDLKETLDIERSLPVFYRERVISDENGDPFQIDQCHFRGDRFRFTIDMSRDEATVDVD